MTWLVLSRRGLDRFGADDVGPRPVVLDDLVELGLLPVVPAGAPVPLADRGLVVVGTTVLRLGSDGPHAWSPSVGGVVPVGADDLALLAGLAIGDADRSAARLVELGFVARRPGGPPTQPPPVPAAEGDDGRSTVPPGPGAIQVHGVHDGEQGVPLAIGMIFASLGAAEGGRLADACDLRPLGRPATAMLAEAVTDPRPLIAFFSNYIWSIGPNLEAAASLKRVRPDAIAIFGGPSVPKYDAETLAFLRDHPWVDVAVLGEGERTAAELLAAIVDGGGRLSADRVRAIPGIAFVDAGAVVRTADRERIADLSDLPSPYLGRLFDDHDGGRFDQWVLETNRGCPYGCVYCDWGSATNSRVRTFLLERVLAEITLGAERGWGSLFLADANFGMLPRDLEIAEWIVHEAARCGHPRHVDATFAKKATDRVVRIVKLFSDAGLMDEGVLALQSVDEGTLVAINRDNIKTERYERLADAFHDQGLPLASDIMVGLPGSTVQSFKRDLDYCLRTGVKARVLSTELLPNSPMNDPGYRATHQLVVNDRNEVVATSTFTVADRLRMARLADLYWLSEHLHLFDLVLRHVQHAHGPTPMDVLDRLDADVDPDRYPTLAFVVRRFREVQAPPCGWDRLYDELGSFLVEAGLVPGISTGLAAVLQVQQARLPLPGRSLPESVDLAHDVLGYLADLAAGTATPIEGYGPVTVIVDDPDGRGSDGFGVSGAPVVDAHGLRHWHFLDDGFRASGEWGLRLRVAAPHP